MSNPVLSSPRLFGGTRAAGVGGAATAPDLATLEQAYASPAATPRDTGRMTYDDVIVRTAGMLVLLVAAGAVTWVLAPGLLWIGMVVGLVLGLVNAFKREPSVPLIMAYAVAQGVFLGGISAVLETAYPGIAVQAVLATAATFAVTLKQPCPPAPRKASTVWSSPESCQKSSPQLRRVCSGRARFAVASFTPTMFGCLASRAMVSTVMSITLRGGML